MQKYIALTYTYSIYKPDKKPAKNGVKLVGTRGAG